MVCRNEQRGQEAVDEVKQETGWLVFLTSGGLFFISFLRIL